MKSKSFITAILLVFISVFSLQAQSASVSEKDLFYIIKSQAKLSDERVHEVISLLKLQAPLNDEGNFEIEGFLYGSGINGAFFVDTDTWDFNITIIDPKTKTPITLKEMIEVELHNGGIKIEFAYKWMFTFLLSKTTLHQLHEATCGRGIGLVGEGGLGLEGSWMPCLRWNYGLIHVAIKAGLGAGLVFPKMSFRVKQIQD